MVAENTHVYTRTTDWRSAGRTLLGIQVTETVEAVSKVITRRESLARELLLAAGAQEAVLVPWLVMIGHASSSDGLKRKREHTFNYAFPRSSVGFQLVQDCIWNMIIVDTGVHRLSSLLFGGIPRIHSFRGVLSPVQTSDKLKWKSNTMKHINKELGGCQNCSLECHSSKRYFPM